MVYCERIGPHKLYLADCREVLPRLKQVDALVTDPPYGIGESGGKNRRRNHRPLVQHAKKSWDKERPEKELFDQLRAVSDVQIIWGGNYFADYLPPSMGWLYWDKRIGGDFSDGELAWTSRQRALRSFSYNSFTGLKGGHLRQHPTQKPVELMKWCLLQLEVYHRLIFDPFMGSGTTGVACAKMGLKFIGVEREPDYFEIACQRIEDAMKQQDLFVPAVCNDHEQPELFVGV